MNNFFGKFELVLVELLFLEGPSLELLLELFPRLEITYCFKCFIELFSFTLCRTNLKSFSPELLFQGFKLSNSLVRMLDKLVRTRLDILLKEFFVLLAEGGNLNTDPVAKNLEIFRVIAGTYTI
jgi:hypothetical protein